MSFGPAIGAAMRRTRLDTTAYGDVKPFTEEPISEAPAPTVEASAQRGSMDNQAKRSVEATRFRRASAFRAENAAANFRE
jgi:hypothetical protein